MTRSPSVFDLSFNPFDESMPIDERLRRVAERSRVQSTAYFGRSKQLTASNSAVHHERPQSKDRLGISEYLHQRRHFPEDDDIGIGEFVSDIAPMTEAPPLEAGLLKLSTKIQMLIADHLSLVVQEDRRALYALSQTCKQMYAVVHDQVRIQKRTKSELTLDTSILQNHKWLNIREAALYCRYADSVRMWITEFDLRMVRTMHGMKNYHGATELKLWLQDETWKELFVIGLLVRAKLAGYGHGYTIIPSTTPRVAFDNRTWLAKAILDYCLDCFVCLYSLELQTNRNLDVNLSIWARDNEDHVAHMCRVAFISGGPVFLHWSTITSGNTRFNMIEGALDLLDQTEIEAEEQHRPSIDQLWSIWTLDGGRTESLQKLSKGRSREIEALRLSKEAMTALLELFSVYL